MLRLLLRYLKNYWLQTILVFLFVGIQAGCQLYLPGMMGNIVDNGVARGDISYILESGMLMLGVSLFAAVCMVASSYYSAYVTASFTSSIRADVFAKVKSFSQTDFNRFGGATLLTRSTSDATQMQIVVINGLRTLLLVPITGLGALVMAFRVNALLSTILLASFTLTTLMILLTVKRSMPLFATRQEKLDRLNILIKEKLSGVRAIRAFRRQDYEKEKFADENADAMAAALRANYAVSFFNPLMQLMMNLTVVVILWIGAEQIEAKVFLIGDLMVFIQYVLLFMSALSLISVLLMAYPQAQVSALRVKEVLDSKNAIVDPPEPRILPQVKGRIEFDAVSFGYDKAEKQVLNSLSFVAEPGKVTAIIGATGSGKTTLVQLMMRLYEVSSGSITIDGTDVRDLAQQDLHQMITYAPQKSILIGNTVMESVRFGDSEASEDDVIAALKTAQAYDFIVSREDGLDSLIYQGGKDFSGGQRQRLSIARALLKKASVVIFDDCFSALDFKTDSLVRQGLRETLQDVTVIIVAQRVSTVKHADQILILDQGSIVGQGRHEELAESCTVYQEILASQAYYEGREESL
jgi:ATP-binding cassette subfamily B protein